MRGISSGVNIGCGLAWRELFISEIWLSRVTGICTRRNCVRCTCNEDRVRVRAVLLLMEVRNSGECLVRLLISSESYS